MQAAQERLVPPADGLVIHKPHGEPVRARAGDHQLVRRHHLLQRKCSLVHGDIQLLRQHHEMPARHARQNPFVRGRGAQNATFQHQQIGAGTLTDDTVAMEHRLAAAALFGDLRREHTGNQIQ
ncbi:hypothetical protein SDC9_198514 [bioreactor metagenome]|uniref:Uncharacterized protein n=1 Tax=bioreactor metagenome TaxID=1076179 RepID=A0A645IR69_9ZZZZ